ncbi:sugar ABC transporter ATP-binding protein [Nonomuraea sp. NPDC059007]|uniref:sugar ABC transporter ATP-binding protein n=1 Tax=Nonomuraea sp. NPDC059007 TaxID=3346692 RepID=UPI003688A52D
MTGPLLLEGITKSYAGTTVLHGVDLRVEPGRIHGLVGENGAGKSTLVKVLCGVTTPGAGRIVADGRAVRLDSPRAARAHGIALVTQEVALVPRLTVLENVFLGRWAHRAGWWRPGADRLLLDGLLGRTGFVLDADRPARELPVADQQRVEILRALASGARVLALDEPTALLPRTEAERLLELLGTLAADGMAIVLVSHRLEEVLSACDVVTVLRDGRHVLTAPAAEQTPRSLVQHMVGRPIEVLYPEPAPVAADAPVVLAATGLPQVARLEVRAGEIVGLAGLTGSGRSAVLRLLFGADRRTSGDVAVAGHPVRPASPRHAMAQGMALVPESRKEQGLVLVRSLRENLALTGLSARQRAGFVRRAAEAREVGQWLDRLDVRAADPKGRTAGLSGGNQQKAMFGKWLMREPKVLLVDEPTRGVDVVVKVEIHRLLVELAARGVAVLMVSSEIEEVLGLSHRVLVLRGGRVAGEFARGAAEREDVMELAFAGRPR